MNCLQSRTSKHHFYCKSSLPLSFDSHRYPITKKQQGVFVGSHGDEGHVREVVVVDVGNHGLVVVRDVQEGLVRREGAVVCRLIRS